MIELVTAEINNCHQRNLDIFASRCDAGQHPVDLDIVSEAEQHLVHQPVRADGARNRNQFGILRCGRDEVMLVETLQLIVADAAGQRGNVIDVRLRDHGLHGRVHIAGAELVHGVGFPQRGQVVVRAHHSAE